MGKAQRLSRAEKKTLKALYRAATSTSANLPVVHKASTKRAKRLKKELKKVTFSEEPVDAALLHYVLEASKPDPVYETRASALKGALRGAKGGLLWSFLSGGRRLPQALIGAAAGGAAGYLLGKRRGQQAEAAHRALVQKILERNARLQQELSNR